MKALRIADPRQRSWVALGIIVSLSASCSEDRTSVGPPVFDADVAPILTARCASCHEGAAPAAGWNASSYLGAIACVNGSGILPTPATLPANESAPILAALSSPPHIGLLGKDERTTIASWVQCGTPARTAGVHAAGIIDPRSPSFHGKLLHDARWAPMLDPNDPRACGTCHEGTPAPRPAGVLAAAPAATSCTTCHSQPGGALACSTCHGNGAKSYPPRDPCFFPGDQGTAGAHAAHVEPSAFDTAGLPCSTCHPAPGMNVIGGLHGNGSVDVIFDGARVAPEASFDRTTKACAVECHDRGGTSPRPAWTDTIPVTCNSCHASPPANHFAGTCTSCHAEANANGTALTPGALHMNGRVDLGDGSGGCGACHGKGSDPWPRTAAHGAHQSPTMAAPGDCTSCHTVPSTRFAKGHLDGVVTVVFNGHALDRGATPAWDGQSCSQVACHGAKLADAPAMPAWKDASGKASACGSCHGIPPAQHTTSTSCDRSTCHGTEVSRSSAGVPSISMIGRTLHINGVIDSVP